MTTTVNIHEAKTHLSRLLEQVAAGERVVGLDMIEARCKLAEQAITSAQGVHVSAATVWELTIKSMLGKLTVPSDLSQKLPGQGLELLSITAEHAEAIEQ